MFNAVSENFFFAADHPEGLFTKDGHIFFPPRRYCRSVPVMRAIPAGYSKASVSGANGIRRFRRAIQGS